LLAWQFDADELVAAREVVDAAMVSALRPSIHLRYLKRRTTD
jgi:hypothetical protein